MADTKKQMVFYCVSTHWDREWYEPFQEYRMWLVETIDHLLELMESRPDFTHAHLDGQTVMVEDYLQIRPENEERLVTLIRGGRISVGPWYVLPDEWLISGESYIRNFLTARATCERYGIKPMDFCYTPDQFGHIAALPMIARGLGLTAGIVWRGTADETHPPHFVWVGPDGSRLPTHKLFDEFGYGWLFHKTRLIQGIRDYQDPVFKEMIAKCIEHERNRVRVPVMLILDGNDHQEFRDDMIDLFAGMQADYPEFDWRWTPLSELGNALAAQAESLPEYQGELREPARAQERACQYLIVQVLSSRYPVKKANDTCQALLERWAEPSALFEMMNGGTPVYSYLDLAWRYLLKNQPHDSICGCSIDQVHRDMRYRFDQARLLADGVTRHAQAMLTAPSAGGEIPQHYAVFNPLPHPRHGVFECALTLPGNWPGVYREAMGSSEPIALFEIVDTDGRTIPHQLRSIERGLPVKHLSPTGRAQTIGGDVYHVCLALELPAGGLTGFTVRPADHPMRDLGSLRTGPLAARNEHFAFSLQPNGLASLEPLGTGRTYDGLFQYEDRADAGDGWVWGDLVNDQTFITPGSRVTTAVEVDGSLRTVLRAERTFDLPEAVRTGASEDLRRDWHRSEKRASMRVVDRFIIEKGAPFLRVRTEVTNNVRDHRFRVGFPTHADTDQSFAETPFAVVQRDIHPPEESAQWFERVNPEKAFTTFFGVRDDRGGLAVVAPHGLHEYEVARSEDRSLWLTLFRSTHKTVQTPGEPDGQLQGTLTFEYLVVPFQGDADHAMLARLAAQAQAGIRIHACAQPTAERSMVSVEGDNVVVTSIKPGRDGASGVIRLWNPGDTEAEACIRLAKAPTKAWQCNLQEETLGDLDIAADGAMRTTVDPRGLRTIKFVWL